ncbi:MAG: S8 family peptidase [Flavobacteriales bacterium]|nr:S8 family peptidase [Flavobacteriales bacterium]
MRSIFFGFLYCCLSVLWAQEAKINFALRAAINQAQPNQKIAVFVRGNTFQIKEEIKRIGGISKLSMTNIVQAEIPASQLKEFSKKNFVEYIEYSIGKGQLLSDTMLIHNNVVPVHQGISPLYTGYTGKNVLMGIIDTGLDIDHPDFKDTLGNTRILKIWDQYETDDGSSGYGYGKVWDSTSINNASCTHFDHNGVDHGTHVAGIACGNGLAVNDYAGVAPEASIIAVASNEGVSNWLSTVVDATKYIYDEAENYNMPCVINISMGDYLGSHDGTDAASLLIDSLMNYKPGRAFVAAAGNAGDFNSYKWHLEHQISSDTTFTWFKYKSNSALGYGAVFYELWADTADFNNVQFAVGANLPSGTYEERGTTVYHNIQNIIGLQTDTIRNDSNQILGIVDFYSELQGDKYLMQVHMQEPDSNQLLFSLKTTGNGKIDVWTMGAFGLSDMVYSPLPLNTILPEIDHYVLPDQYKTMVSSFQNHPSVIAVANFSNRAQYYDIDTILRSTGRIPGEIGPSSSWGPNRRGYQKPDIAATGDWTIGPVGADCIAANLGPGNRERIAKGGMHRTNGGTSMASPVVAGVAALYLEKCPKAIASEIKNAILSTAKQDTFTLGVPNYRYGYGKVDAFAALNTSNFMVSLGSDMQVCDGDSVELTAGVFNSYLWSNNDTTSSIYIDTTSSNYVEVENNSGCKSLSDTVNVVWHPLPNKPVVTVFGNDTLMYSTNLDLQWYYNTSILSGENDTILVAQNNGDYFVQVIDSFGCTNYSDTVSVVTVYHHELTLPQGLSFYPNPSKGQFNIQLPDVNTFQQIVVIDIQGKELIKKEVRNLKQITIDASFLPNGIYYIQFVSVENMYLDKLILSR